VPERATNDLNDPLPIPDRPVDEQDLARRAVAGDRRAFAELYDLHVGAVYRYAFFRVRTAAEAEDVTSEVFQRALVAMPRYEPRRPFLAFLYTIARNVVTDRLRRSHPEASFEDALAHPTDAPGPDERAAASDEVRELRAAIAKLTPVQQEVMVMMLEDRSVKEIAQLTGKREGTIRGIHMRALEALREMLGEVRS